MKKEILKLGVIVHDGVTGLNDSKVTEMSDEELEVNKKEFPSPEGMVPRNVR